jgi:hypothetical protein
MAPWANSRLARVWRPPTYSVHTYLSACFMSVFFMCYLKQVVEWIVKDSACSNHINFVDPMKERRKLSVVKEI